MTDGSAPPPHPERRTSTGRLPDGPTVASLLADAHRRHRAEGSGAVSDAYPALAAADPAAFGLSVVGVGGAAHDAGDAHVAFPIMSVSKPFTFALVCDALGPAEAAAAVGVNATGVAFDAVEAVGRDPRGRTNPMVNPGAIATAALVPAADPGGRWERIRAGLSAFAGRDLRLDEATLLAADRREGPNQAIVAALDAVGALAVPPADALHAYNRQCCLLVSAHDLAVMGATLADGGVNPLTGRRVVDAESCRHTLAVMATAGLYETSGDWLYEVGMPAKSGISGGLVTVAPGKGGLGSWSPPLDASGTSVRGRLAAVDLGRSLGLDLFASAPEVRPAR